MKRQLIAALFASTCLLAGGSAWAPQSLAAADEVKIDSDDIGGVVTSTKAEGGYSGGYILTADPDFKRAVAKQYEMIVFPETVGAFVVDLKGTFRAMAAGRKCLQAQ